ncbi:glycosyltransferase family 4 protein [Cylindrospermum sp. FACHB-282]|uniref:glycosyltransferase family 4 protein n=1 Tax=Cylindrospermum sp. FACHB-282 TaxID=2692794 RepID=UPI001688DBC9|nr:glycosyltransferase family 4 protein [Cylindrospermum sp. FACHB-282]MBD2387137.1 glycosyltransferase family 4 protein [Cylindrospermum sp. FACHB-282]
MKIAFISYEYPPDTAYGGIATYVYQAARVLQQRGHQVEVFAGSTYRTRTETENEILVHRINESDLTNFVKRVGQLFVKRHSLVKFDVVEGTDYNADAREAVRLVPEIPLVVKLHTPCFLASKISEEKPSLLREAHKYMEALRGKSIKPRWKYNFKDDIEYIHALNADEIVAPSQAIADELIEAWKLNRNKISLVPYPYVPSRELLEIPVENQTNVVTFIGRLENRKGILDLAQAIPIVLKQHPEVSFRFIGRTCASPNPNLHMRQYLEGMLQPYRNSLEFIGFVPFDKIPSYLRSTELCVFPSLWDNFPFVCLEAMAAARGIVGSSSGGMAEQLNHGECGRLVPPYNPNQIAKAVVKLLRNPSLRMELGEAARKRVLNEYNIERIGLLQENSYARAIKRREAMGSRFYN